jgi:hypothetical protein
VPLPQRALQGGSGVFSPQCSVANDRLNDLRCDVM